MKARLLKKLLNDTKYSVHNNKECICIGSPLCPDLINVNKESLRIKYTLDTWNAGKQSVEGRANGELLFIWNRVEELIENKEILEIINGDDEIENPLPVFSYEEGEIKESFTDKYGYPNITHSGYIMYNNTHFKTRMEAIEYGISDEEAYVRLRERDLIDYRKKITKLESGMAESKSNLDTLKKMKKLWK